MRDDDFTNSSAESATPEWNPVAVLWDYSSWMFLTLGFLVFELTSDVFLGIVVTCLKLGGGDVLTAFWARRDPVPGRGAALSCFCFASACFKIAGAAILICLSIIVAEVMFQARLNLDKFIAGLCLIFTGAFLGTMTCLVGLTIALRHHRRLWLDREFRQSRRYRVFPPVYIGARNQIAWILGVTKFHVFLFLVGLMVGCGSMIADPRGNMVEEAVGVLIFYAVLLAFPVWQLIRSPYIIAATPENCWPELATDADLEFENDEVSDGS